MIEGTLKAEALRGAHMRVFGGAEGIEVIGTSGDPPVADKGSEVSVMEESAQAGDDLHVLVLLLEGGWRL